MHPGNHQRDLSVAANRTTAPRSTRKANGHAVFEAKATDSIGAMLNVRATHASFPLLREQQTYRAKRRSSGTATEGAMYTTRLEHFSTPQACRR
jgi:hypothetical protein